MTLINYDKPASISTRSKISFFLQKYEKKTNKKSLDKNQQKPLQIAT